MIKNFKNLWNTLKERWVSESPEFWVAVQKLALGIVGAAIAVIGADQTFGLMAYGVSEIVFKVAGYVIVAAAALGLTAKLTKK